MANKELISSPYPINIQYILKGTKPCYYYLATTYMVKKLSDLYTEEIWDFRVIFKRTVIL